MNNMYKDIYDLVLEYTEKNMFFDFEAIVKIIEYIVPRFGISFKDVSFGITECGATYFFSINASLKTIYFDKVTFYKYNHNYPVYIQNLTFIKGLVHELEHVKQYELLDKLKGKEIKDPLIKLEYILNKCFFDYSSLISYTDIVPTLENIEMLNNLNLKYNEEDRNKIIENYQNHHDYAISERFADIKAALFIINFIESNEKNEDRKKEALALYQNRLYGLSIYNTLTFFDVPNNYTIISFLKTFGFSHKMDEVLELIKQIEECYNLDDETRLLYGIGISSRMCADALEKRQESYEIYKEIQTKRRIQRKLNKIRNKNNK